MLGAGGHAGRVRRGARRLANARLGSTDACDPRRRPADDRRHDSLGRLGRARVVDGPRRTRHSTRRHASDARRAGRSVRRARRSHVRHAATHGSGGDGGRTLSPHARRRDVRARRYRCDRGAAALLSTGGRGPNLGHRGADLHVAVAAQLGHRRLQRFARVRPLRGRVRCRHRGREPVARITLLGARSGESVFAHQPLFSQPDLHRRRGGSRVRRRPSAGRGVAGALCGRRRTWRTATSRP